MQVNNILNCHKPKRFTGLKDTGKVRYKHYEQMPDEVLSARSMAKAYCEVRESKKSRLLKAMPAITNTLIATSLALTQPGKLSAKVSTGVGFLALISGMNFVSEKISKYAYTSLQKNNQKKDNKNDAPKRLMAAIAGTIGAAGVIFGTAAALAKNKTKILNSSNKLIQFLKSEGQKFTEELNNSKLGKRIEENLMNRSDSSKKLINKARYILPFGLIAGSAAADSALRTSISNDFSKKAVQNFIKGKAAQQDAKAHFDSIDAIEV